MKVRVSTIIKGIIVLLLIMQLSYTKLLGGFLPIFSTSYISNQLGIFFLILIIISVVLSVTYYNGLKNGILILDIVLIILIVCNAIIVTMDKYHCGLIKAVGYALNYLYVLLAIPIFRMLTMKKWKMDDYLKLLVILCAGSYVIRGTISLYFVATGMNICPAIALEGAAENWIRNGILRINPPCLSLLYLPAAFWLLSKSSKFIQKVGYILLIVLGVGYMTVITQARSMMIYQFFVLMLLFLLKNKPNSRKGIAAIVIIGVIAVVLINSPVVNQLIDSFSAKNAETGGSTTARFYAIAYFGNMFLKTPLRGIGFWLDKVPKALPVGDISDIGLLRSVYMLGSGMIVIYLVMFIRGFYVAWKVRKMDRDDCLLVLGMTLLFVLTDINIDCFWDVFAFAVPFYIATVEYIYKKNTLGRINYE